MLLEPHGPQPPPRAPAAPSLTGGVAGRAATALAVFVLALVAWGSSAPPAAACSCGGPAGDQEAFARAVAVFTGTVTKHEELPGPTPWTWPTLGGSNSSELDQRVVWTFAVDRVFKGEVAETQTVASVGSGSTCGLHIPRKEGPFLVFTSDPWGPDPPRDGPNLFANLCGGTRSIGDGPVPAGFGDGAAPEPGSVAGATTAASSWPVWAIAASAVVAALAVAVLARRFIAARRRAPTRSSMRHRP